MAEGFLDRLARQSAEAEAIEERSRRSAGAARRDEFLAGQAAASDIIGRVATFGSTYERNAASLAKAAQQQPPGLAGRVAAGDLAEAAQVARHEADRLAMNEQLARDENAMRARYYQAAKMAVERAWDRDRT